MTQNMNVRHYYHSGDALATTSKPVTQTETTNDKHYQIELEEMNKDHNSRGNY